MKPPNILLYKITIKIYNANSMFRKEKLKNSKLLYENNICLISDACISTKRLNYVKKHKSTHLFVSTACETIPIHRTAILLLKFYITKIIGQCQHKNINPCFNKVSIINFAGNFEIFATLYLPRAHDASNVRQISGSH